MRLLFGGALAVLLVAAHVRTPTIDMQSIHSNSDRAVTTYVALQQSFYLPKLGLYSETAPPSADQPIAFHWPYSQVMNATLDLAALPDLGARFRADLAGRLQGSIAYWDERAEPPGYASGVLPPLGKGGDLYYDDNAWTGLALVRHHQITGDQATLARARQIFDLLVSGWDNDPAHPAPGGIFWVRAEWNRDRNVVSTAPAAILGLELFRLTAEPWYYDWALTMYDWVEANLRAPNGLYWDHIDLAGTIERTHWSYNQGTMIGAAVLLYEVTGHTPFLRRAEAIAGAALDYFNGDRLLRQPAAFNAIFFRNLLRLEALTADPRYRRALEDYAGRIWDGYRDPRTALVRLDPEQPYALLDQAAAVQVFAMLALPVRPPAT